MEGLAKNEHLLFLVLHKFQALDPAFQPSDYLTDAGKRGFAAAITSCPLPGDPTIPFDDVLKVMPDRAKTEAMEEYPTLRFAQPVFIGTGLADTAAAPEFQYGIASAACREGSIVETHYYPGQDHGGTVNASLIDSVPFVKKLFAGQPITENCATLKAPPTIK